MRNGLLPREKLETLGQDSLSNSELLAIILNTGTIKESVMSMSARIMRDYGVGAFSSVKDFQQLQQEFGLSRLKSMQVVAALELGRRLFVFSSGRKKILSTPERVYEKYKFLAEKTKEELRVLYLDARLCLLGSELIALGSLNVVNSYKRDILSSALERNAAGIILVHNHPSGDPRPSENDITYTKNITKISDLMELIIYDHIIIGSEDFFSFRQEGLLPELNS